MPFGRRLSQLLKEAKAVGVTRIMAEKAVGVDYRTIEDWKKRETPPTRGDGQQKAKQLLEYLEAAVQTKPGGADVLNESRWTMSNEPIKYAEPLDFKKDALNALGRGRHAIALIRARVRASELTLAELSRLLALADHETADAQSYLMEQIEINDRGQKI